MQTSWWREAVMYQVYWRSFQDSNGDGIGDLQGVISRLDYLNELGVDIIWLNPMYASPDLDNGYDISDYEAILPKAGSMAEVEALIAAVHERGMRIIMDLVVNHSSDQHAWFAESRQSSGADNEKRDWYIWRDPRPDGGPPNNWRSYFAPSCWTFDETRGQYYFHSFAKEQPDLNWANPVLREAVYAMMHRWFQKGIDGFRMDAICMIGKHWAAALEGVDGVENALADAVNPYDLRYLKPAAILHDYLREMHEQVLAHYDVFSVGEAAFISADVGAQLIDPARREMHSLFHFEVCDEMPTWDLPRFRAIQNKWAMALEGRAVVGQFLNNHDHVRQVTRYGNDAPEWRVASAKLLAILVHLLPGIPTIYQGEEIGMTGLMFERIEDYQDILTHHRYREQLELGATKAEALAEAQRISRDQSRTPMQWDESDHAGFTSEGATPWLNVNPNYMQVNVQKDRNAEDSIFRFYQQLIGLRKTFSVLAYGGYSDCSEGHEHVYAFMRIDAERNWLVILNTSQLVLTWDVATEVRGRVGQVMISTHARFGECFLADRVALQGYEGIVIELD